ncbi:MAG: hypothetical protein ACK5MH_09785 [Bacteroidales bacterium]
MNKYRITNPNNNKERDCKSHTMGSIGWNLGGKFGHSKWYGKDDNKWFK